MRNQMTPLLTLFALLASCGSSSDSNTSEDSLSNTTIPDSWTSSGTDISIDGDTYSAEVNGVEFESTTIYLGDYTGQPILQQSISDDESKAYIAIDGDYVAGFAGSYSNSEDDIENFAFYGLVGEESQSTLSGSVQYNGAYMTADSTSPNNPNYVYEAIVVVDFDSGGILGRTLSTGTSDSNVVISGTLDGTSVNLTINDQYGEHEAVGGLYGPDSEEIAAGFDDGEIAGLLYGHN